MRIALVTREYPPDTAWGGIGTHYGAFAAGLRAAGCDVEVFTQGLVRASTEVEGGVVVHRVVPRRRLVGRRRGGELAGGSMAGIGLFAAALAREMGLAFSHRHRDRAFDVVDAHEHLGVGAFINRRHRSGVLTVTRYQTAYDSMVRRGLANWPRSQMVRHLERWAILRAHCRIATSGFVDRLAQQDFPGVPPADAIIPNLTELAPAPSAADVTREPLMLFVGRMMPGHKNPDLAARAFAALAAHHVDWRIEFAGQDIPLASGETMWQRCQATLSPFDGRYRYHGVLPRAVLADLYRRARVLVVPSAIESYGLVAVEAMAMGCVPVVADDTSLPEIVGGAGVVFKNGSLDELVTALRRLLTRDSELRWRSAACISRAATIFDSRAIVARNVSCFEQHLPLGHGWR